MAELDLFEFRADSQLTLWSWYREIWLFPYRIVHPHLLLCYMAMGLFSSMPSAVADGVKDQGLPCNELCRAWMGNDDPGRVTEPQVDRIEQQVPRLVRHDVSVGSSSTLKVRHAKPSNAEAEQARKPLGRNGPGSSNITIAAKNSRLDLGTVPRSVGSSSPAPHDGSLVIVDKSRSGRVPRRQRTARGTGKIAVAPKTDAAGAQDSLPLSKPSRLPDTPEPLRHRSHPASSASAISSTDAPPPSTAPSANPEPKADAPIPSGIVVTPPASTKADASVQKPADTIESAVNRVGVESTLVQPPAVVASLPPPVAQTDYGTLRTDPAPPAHLLPVTIAQISAEPRGTNVHVVVVNVSLREFTNLDVTCDARDAQGLQVAEASAHIASIAPSDVAFQQVLFPSEITTHDNKFACNVADTADADDAKP